MALINCSECNKEVSDKAACCIHCGNPIASKPNKVKINFPVWIGQLLMNNCYVYDEKGKEIARCKQGETVTFECVSAMKITVKMQNCFGKPSQTVNPGDNYKVEFRGFGRIYLAKVDSIV
ncbi:MAG: hypothetical protein FWD26_02315 [Treponema sp.]|nr:hypothetical protein [Treponema sp.]